MEEFIEPLKTDNYNPKTKQNDSNNSDNLSSSENSFANNFPPKNPLDYITPLKIDSNNQENNSENSQNTGPEVFDDTSRNSIFANKTIRVVTVIIIGSLIGLLLVFTLISEVDDPEPSVITPNQSGPISLPLGPGMQKPIDSGMEPGLYIQTIDAVFDSPFPNQILDDFNEFTISFEGETTNPLIFKVENYRGDVLLEESINTMDEFKIELDSDMLNEEILVAIVYEEFNNQEFTLAFLPFINVLKLDEFEIEIPVSAPTN